MLSDKALRFSKMEMATIQNVSQVNSARAPVSLFGQVNLVSDSGEILNLWRVKEPRCSIGSGIGNTIRLAEAGITAEHALIVFGKNRTLIKSLGGTIRIGGRAIGETLIDEPTLVQFSGVRLIIIPPRFALREDFAGHQISSGTVADQAARLKEQPSLSKVRERQSHECSTTAVPKVDDLAEPIRAPMPTVDLTPILSALIPIQDAIAETKNGVASLKSRVDETEARAEATIPQEPGPDLSHLLDRIDERMGAFTTHCESLFSTVANSLDSRFNQLGDLVQKLSETSIAYSEPNQYRQASQEYFADEVGAQSPIADPVHFAPPSPDEVSVRDDVYLASNTLIPAIEPVTCEEESAYQPASYEASDAYQPSSYEELAQEELNVTIAHRELEQDTDQSAITEENQQEAKLPNWFTGYSDPATDMDSEGELDPPGSVESSVPVQELDSLSPLASLDEPSIDPASQWGSARLNPIYAEDTNGWLNAHGMQVENEFDSQISANEDLSYEGPISEEAPQLESTSDSDSEAFDYNAYRSNDATDIEDSHREYARDVDDGLSAAVEPEPEVEEPASSSGYSVAYDDHDSVAENAESHSVSRLENRDDSEDEAEESIEEYMNRLLQRVKGEASPEPIAKADLHSNRQASRAIKPDLPKADMSQSSVDANSEVQSQSSSIAQDLPSPESQEAEGKPARRTMTADRGENLSALRDLANETARSAIQKSSKKRLEVGISGKIMISGMGLVGGLVLLFLNGLNANIVMLGMVCSFIIFLLWGYEASTQIKQLTQQNAKNAGQQPNPETQAKHRPASDSPI
jgi:hypothetical protein